MRRSLAGLLLLISFVLFALSISAWWFQHVAFSPSADTSVTYAILGDEDIRGEIATLIATADAGELGTSTANLKQYIEQSTRLTAGASLMTNFVSAAHSRLIGDFDGAVQITAEEQYTIVRDERAALSSEITLPVPQVGSLSFIKSASWWIMLISGGGGLLMMIAGLVTRPERGELTFGIAVGMASLAVFLVLFGYLIPVGPLTALSDTTWMGVFPQLANRSRNTTLVMTLVSGAIAAAVLLGTSGLRQRRQRSTPLSVGRYREQHSWSR